MTDQHRATPEQWEHVETCAGMKKIPWATAACLLELRDTIRALCKARNDLVVCSTEQNQRIEALEATQLEQAESHRFCVDAIVRRVEALEAAPAFRVLETGERIQMNIVQDKLDRLIALDAADPTPDPAMTELRAASAEAQPGGLVERVADVFLTKAFTADDTVGARAAIREVAAAASQMHASYILRDKNLTWERVAQWLELEASHG